MQIYQDKLKLYRVVLPSCQSAECGDFICERKKPVKRPAQRSPQEEEIEGERREVTGGCELNEMIYI